MLQKTRAIQIGLKSDSSKYYVENIISIEDVTELAKDVGKIHDEKKEENIQMKINLLIESGKILMEKPYLPICEKSVLERLAMTSGTAAMAVKKLGRGKIT